MTATDRSHAYAETHRALAGQTVQSRARLPFGLCLKAPRSPPNELQSRTVAPMNTRSISFSIELAPPPHRKSRNGFAPCFPLSDPIVNLY
jgi:hypothetical protein